MTVEPSLPHDSPRNAVAGYVLLNCLYKFQHMWDWPSIMWWLLWVKWS